MQATAMSRHAYEQQQQPQPPYQQPGRYEAKSGNYTLENILFAVDVDKEAEAEMKAATAAAGGGKAPALRRVEAVKQALLLFVHSKLAMNPLHQFAFVTVSRGPAWHQREFTSNLDTIGASVRALSSESVVYTQFDLSALLQLAAAEARASVAQGRSLRVILVYCRSSVVPEFSEQWLERQNNFTLDALYIHDKPAPFNCPQRVYDALVEALEHVGPHEGYIYESSSGSARTLFKQMCLLLSHPHQRLVQDDSSVIKDLAQVRLAPEIPAVAPQSDGGSGRGG